ncbi:MAG: hypothetical protein LBK26_02655 [Rickettsiales bacterium]|jgi:hypothetical protein|nr:hypothetical protein [Rickettsiales bacterium]
MAKEQTHLDYKDTINFGGYYTPDHLVDMVYNMLRRNIPDMLAHKVIDTSCGYGNFLREQNSIGADCDKFAIEQAASNSPDGCMFFHHNSLQNVRRDQYCLNNNDKIIIVGNPPYNDTTSIIRNEIKHEICGIDADLRHRDMGISFLLSYNKLGADYICVLHPLSYLIKKANFDSLGNFKNNYKLIDSVIVSSGEFSATSKTTQFPIVIALYKRGKGMDYEFIKNYEFRTDNVKAFKLSQFDRLCNYITKYPNQRFVEQKDAAAFFWTMRDINALKRTRTFTEKEVRNSIRVARDKLALYCYADIFKDYAAHIPYYFGNSDIPIDKKKFDAIADMFLVTALRKYKFLSHLLPPGHENINYDMAIHQYFKDLLGEYYVDKKD